MFAKRTIACAAAALLSVTASSVGELFALRVSADDPKQYTYEITPLLVPFNDFFYVKTDNPDPKSFRFADKSSKYSESAVLTAYENYYSTTFKDIVYEDEKTKRVGGGYIFSGGSTDGGEIVLQTKGSSGTWTDSDVTLNLPVLVDEVDYLIDTYATKSDFFENMSAVQSGFSSICYYGGPTIRGELYRNENTKWRLTNYTHADQNPYILSPYGRNDTGYLFTSSLYPYRYDSLGFPSIMSSVAKRLDSTATTEWDDYNHYTVHVTYNGVTKSYGGAGNGGDNQIGENDVTTIYNFPAAADSFTFEGLRDKINEYDKIKLDDDIPREDALTWGKIYDTVGNGSWVKTATGYAYIYRTNNNRSFYDEEWGVGNSIYWSGSLRFASGEWVDGRYTDVFEKFVKGKKFEDYPTANVIFSNYNYPEVTFDKISRYNYSTSSYEYIYENVSVTDTVKRIRFCYNSTDNNWTPDYNSLGGKSFNDIKALAEKGLIDKSVVDRLTLTADDLKALGVDSKTDIDPEYGFSYDGKDDPGTPFGSAYTAPTITFEKGDGAVKLTWEKVEGAEKYAVYGYKNGKWEAIGQGDSNSYVLKDLQPGKEYKVCVATKLNGKWYNDPSNAIVVTPKAKSNPTVKAESGKNAVKLTWNAVEGAEKYAIVGYVSGGWKTLAEGYGTSYVLNDLKAGTEYKVAVSAMFGGKWNTDFTNAVTVTPKGAAEYPAVKSQVSGSKFRIKWTAVGGAEKYGLAVYQSGRWIPKVQFDADVTEYTSPAMKKGEYKLVLVAKIGGKWELGDVNSRAFTVTIA